MIEPVIGQRYDTPSGRGTCVATTPYQAQVQPDDGSDPYWCTHACLQGPLAEEDELPPTIEDLIDNAMTLLGMAKAAMQQGTAAAPPQDEEKSV